MRHTERDAPSRVAEALGASRAVPLPGLPSGGPLDLLQLRAEVVGRLRSTGGRPTDPEWDVQRLVPFREERWRQLVELARELSSADRRVSAGQLAAILIERAMNSVHPSDRGR